MKNLIKYEAKKGLFSKLVILAIVAVFELFFLFGLYFTDFKDSPFMSIGVIGLSCCAAAGITFIGIQSMFTLYRDLNTKQSYMLFMTPNNSYQILGAKVIESALSIVLAGVFFALLATIDFSLLLAKAGGIKQLVELFGHLLSIDITLNDIWSEFITTFLAVVGSWIMITMIGYLSITLSSTVLSGKKFNGLVSFGLFLLLSIGLDNTLFRIPDKLFKSYTSLEFLGFTALLMFIVSVILYFITSYIMEKKLSV